MAPGYVDEATYPPPPGPWQPTQIIAFGGWHIPEFNAQWIAHSGAGTPRHSPDGESGYYLEEFYYRFAFNLDTAVDLDAFVPRMNFYADDSIYDIYINGERLTRRTWVERFYTTDGSGNVIAKFNPWLIQSYLDGQGASATLAGNWQHGENEIVVHIRSQGYVQGFLAEFVQDEGLCKPKLTLRKTVNGGPKTASDFTLRASGGSSESPTTISGRTGDASITDAVVTPGTYTLSETPAPELDGYRLSISCVVTTKLEDGGTTTSTVAGPSLTLTPYDSADCEFTNELIAQPLLTLRKIVQNTRVGTLGPQDFTLRADGPTPISGVDGSASITRTSVEPGTYQLSEDPVDGYSPAGPFTCVDSGGNPFPVTATNVIELARGQDVTCTVTNIDSAADLTLNKVVINDSGGTATPADFILVATGPIERRYSTGQTLPVPPGTYVLSEEGPNGYGALFSCSINGGAALPQNRITLADGDQAVCQITNNDVRVEIALTGESGQIPDVAEPGEILTYTVTLTNDGETTALYDLLSNLDPNLAYVPGSVTGPLAGTEPLSTSPLQWNGLELPPGTTTITFQARVATVLPPGTARISSCVGSACAELVAAGSVSVSKKLIGESGGTQPDLAEPGEILTYEVTLTNEGEAPAIFDLGDAPSEYSSYVPGSTRGTAGAGEPEGPMPLIWRGISVNPGQPVTVVYDVRVADVLPPGTAALRNIAYSPQAFEAQLEEQGGGAGAGGATGGAGGGGAGLRYPGPDYCSTAAAGCLEFETLNVSFAKIAHMPTASRGMKLPFTLQVTNHSSAPVRNLTVTDILPAGFTYVEGSATMNGEPVIPVQEGRQLHFTIAQLEAKSTISIDLSMQALSMLKPGMYSNRAGMRDPSGREIVGTSAAFEITIEPYFDCTDIIGRVFDDENRNGYQDDGEIGIPGARVTGTAGIHVTTDGHGLFHVACADIPDSRLGTNFIMKLDPRSLPSGYRIISENPRTVRLTAGKTAEISFAAALARVVRLDLTSAAFLPGSTRLAPVWDLHLHSLIATLEREPSALRIVYRDSLGDRALGQQRLRELRGLIARLWREKGLRYRLEIETELMTPG